MNDARSASSDLPAENLPSFPRMWPGFALAGLFLLAEIIEVQLIDLRFPGDRTVGPIPLAISLAGLIYWLFCIHRLHRILGVLAPGGYPISPARAAYFHLIPIFNFLWLVHWPYVLTKFLNSLGKVHLINGQLLGLFLLLSVILDRWLDGALGLAGFFAVTAYITGKIRQQLAASNRT